MIAKIIAHGPTRDDARRKLGAALRATTLFGLVTNKTFLANICENPVFAAGQATTAFLTDHFADDPSCRVEPPDESAFAVAAVLRCLEGARGLVDDESYIGWRSGGPVWITLELAAHDTVRTVDVQVVPGSSPRCFNVTDSEAAGEEDAPIVAVEVVSEGPEELVVCVGGVRRCLRYVIDGAEIWLDDGSATYHFVDRTHAPAEPEQEAAGGSLRAPFDGMVWAIQVNEGDTVEKGQVVLVLEAMKMEHRIAAGTGGVVTSIKVALEDQVKTRQLLAEIVPDKGE
jgi:geranyl-CoA carboxylase alpha subunit